jgi:hypothetical protein
MQQQRNAEGEKKMKKEKERKIKFVVDAARWFDKVNGNTYHSCRITRIKDGGMIYSRFQYGYGDHYRQTALMAMADAKWLPVKYRKENGWYYERENNYPIIWNVRDGLKRDALALVNAK